MAAASLLKKIPSPSEAQIDSGMSGNICRCGTYSRIKKAIQLASQTGFLYFTSNFEPDSWAAKSLQFGKDMGLKVKMGAPIADPMTLKADAVIIATGSSIAKHLPQFKERLTHTRQQELVFKPANAEPFKSEALPAWAFDYDTVGIQLGMWGADLLEGKEIPARLRVS